MWYLQYKHAVNVNKYVNYNRRVIRYRQNTLSRAVSFRQQPFLSLRPIGLVINNAPQRVNYLYALSSRLVYIAL